MLAVMAVGTAEASGQNFTVERLASGLTRPTFVTQAPGDDNTLYITELDGAIKQLDLSTGIIDTFATLSASTVAYGGLHTIAFHPDFQNNGKFYAAHLVDSSDFFPYPASSLDEYTVDIFGAVSLTRNLFQERHLSLSNGSHSIGWIGFDPTAPDSETLYVTIGDGFCWCSLTNTSPYGKVLMFDTSQASPAWEVLHSGLRNPWKASFDSATGDLFIGDVGHSLREEVNFALSGTSGFDFGWATREGTTIGIEPDDPTRTTIDPIFETFHRESPAEEDGHDEHEHDLSGNFSITGGYVYRGPVSELQGQYFFADFVSQRIWSGEFDRSTDPNSFDGDNLTGVTERKAELDALIPGGGSLDWIVSFGEDNARNLYLVDFGDGFLAPPETGEIFRITAVPEPAVEFLQLASLVTIGLCYRKLRSRD